jgi:hypothetical protein
LPERVNTRHRGFARSRRICTILVFFVKTLATHGSVSSDEFIPP